MHLDFLAQKERRAIPDFNIQGRMEKKVGPASCKDRDLIKTIVTSRSGEISASGRSLRTE